MVEEKETKKMYVEEYHCIKCGMMTPHVKHDEVIPDGMMCSLCGTCFVYDDVSGVEFEYVEKNSDT